MDLRRNLEDGVSEGGTGKESHGKQGITQDADANFPSGLEGGHEIQGENIGRGDLVISGE